MGSTVDGSGSGSVAQLWRHPAKSMMGETVATAVLDRQGLVGDRTWAVRDEVRGGLQGARKLGGLMQLKARYRQEPTREQPSPPLDITLPDGSTVTSADPDVDARLSEAIGHPVTLWPLRPASEREHYRRTPMDSDDLLTELRTIFGRTEDEPLPDLSRLPPEIFEFETPPGTYNDVHPLLVVTTTSLATLQRLAPESRVDVRRFRPNIVLDLDGTPDGDAGGFPEQDWIGRRLQVGGAVLEIASPCPRCVMITRPFDDLPQDRDLLRTVVREADQNIGVYAEVVEPGPVSTGDRFTSAHPSPLP